MEAEQRPPSKRDRVVRATCVALTSFALVLLAGAASHYQPGGDESRRVELAQEPLPAPVPEDPRGREDGGGKNYEALRKGNFMDWYRVKSADNYFGSSTMPHVDPHLYNKLDFLQKRDCRLAAIFGITHISDHCTIKCEACNASTFRANCSIFDDGFCKDCLAPDMDCGHGYHRVDCGPKKDPGSCKRCLDCPLGFWRSGCSGGLESLGRCLPCQTFPKGSYNDGCLWVNPGVEAKCQDCGQGRWLDGCGAMFPGSCKNCTQCGAHDHIVTDCGQMNDAVCGPCKDLLESEACDEGTYRKGCGYGSRGVCTACASEPCAPGFYKVGCGGHSAGTCVKCEGCPAGQVREGCTADSPGQCEPCGTCEDGEWRENCVYLDEGVCSVCPDCGADKYSEGCAGLEEGRCLDCIQCSGEQYESRECKGTSSRECDFCSNLEACLPGMYRGGCGSGSKGACASCPSCGKDTYRTGCGGLTEGVCAECPKTCMRGEWLQGCGDMSPGTCAPCAVYSEGFYNEGCEWTSPGEEVECRDCGPGMWLSGCGGQNPGTCHPVTAAGEAQYEVSAPGKYKDRQVGECADLTACEAGFWRPCGNGSMDVCSTCKTCPAGEYRASCGGMSEGSCEVCPGCQHGFVRVGCGGAEEPMDQGRCEPCGSCSSGEYRHGCVHMDAGHCKECEDCGEERYLTGCGGDEPGECHDCTQCKQGDFERQSCTAHTDRECVPCAELPSCGAGLFRDGCSLLSEGHCEECAGCPEGSYRKGCSGLNGGECAPCETNCPNEQYRSGCSGAEEGTCAFCEACESKDEYRSGCEELSGGTCLACTVCGANEYQSSPCTRFADGSCDLCGHGRHCEPGMYRKGCGHGAEGECAACEDCPSGEYRVGCGGIHAGECVACPADCPAGEYLKGCERLSEGNCTDCPACDAGYYLTGCGGWHRGSCIECESVPCPPHHTRVGCGGHDVGHCVRSWMPVTPMPQMFQWSKNLLPGSDGHGCVDWGQEGVPNVERRSHMREHSYLRLAACTEGEAAGKYVLPTQGDWLLQFFFGVPEYNPRASGARVALFPEEKIGEPDVNDATTVTINGESETFFNRREFGPGKYKLHYRKIFRGVKDLHFRFNWTSSVDRDHLHMLASNGEVTYLGDNLPVNRAEELLGERDAQFKGWVINVADDKPLVKGKTVKQGDDRGVKLDYDQANLTMFVGTSLMERIDVLGRKAEFDQLVPTGKYVCQATYPGYYTWYEPNCNIKPPSGKFKGGLVRPVALSPFLNPGEGRFVVTWGAQPPDIEIRLDVPLPEYQFPGCTVRYTNVKCEARIGGGKASLEKAVIDGYGPGSIFVNNFIEGDYYLRVKHFGGWHKYKNNIDPDFMASQAMVTAYLPSYGMLQYHIGETGYTSGQDWMVIKIDGATMKITECTPSECPPPSKWD